MTPVGFRFSRFVEEVFGEDVLRDEDDGCEEGVEDAKEVALEFGGAGEHDSEG